MPARVLIIEDDPILRQLLGTALEQAGFDADVAADGALGLKSFNLRHHAVVVTDIIMPEREGIETLREIKARAPETRIIAMSGGGRIGATPFLSLATTFGADGTLAKPFKPSALVAMIKSMLGTAAA